MLQEATFEIIGRVGAVEVNQARTKARVSLACNHRWRDGNETRERTDWYWLDAFKQRIDFAEAHLSPGRYVRVRGAMQPDSYEKDGQKHHTYSLIAQQFDFLDPPPARD